MRESIYYSTAAVARLANYGDGTLRNYVYLMTLLPSDRQRRNLQEPPEKMPRPRKSKHNGRLQWPVAKVDAWIAWRRREGIQPKQKA